MRYRVRDRNNKISWLELRAKFRTDEHNNPVVMEGTAWNISDRMAQDAWLSGLLDSYPDPILILDSDNRGEWANAVGSAMAESAGIAPTGVVPWEALPQLRGEGLPELVARARLTPGARHTAQVRIRLPEGGEEWYLVGAVVADGWAMLQWVVTTDRVKAERADAERAAAVENLNEALRRALNTGDVVAAIVAHALPALGADGVVMHDLTGPTPRLVGLTGHGQEFIGELNEMGWDQRLEAAALADGPQYIPSIGDLADGWPQLVPLALSGGKRAWSAIPLVVADEVVGSAVFTWSQPHEFDADSKSLLGTVGVVAAGALRSAAAIERAERHAALLAQELLSGPPPKLPGVHAAYRYRTAPGTGEEKGVGGHWYDLISLSGGRVMAVVGQVIASPDRSRHMGTLRQLVLALAALDMPPDDLLAHVNDRAHGLGRPGSAVTATCQLVVHDPTTGLCAITSAGHAPPVLMSPEQPPAAVDMPVGDPLGVARVPAQVTTLDLPENTVVLLAGGDLPEDTERHLTEAAAHYRDHTPPPVPADGQRTRWLDGMCEAITGQAVFGDGDLVLLALTAGRLPGTHVGGWTLPRTAESVADARADVSELLAAWGRQDWADAVELVVSELVTNSCRHARGIGIGGVDPDEGTIQLRLLNLADHCVVEVYDGSKAAPQVRHPSFEDEFGRGLVLVALYAQRWGSRYTRTGKCIWAAIDGTDPEAGAPAAFA